MRAPPAPQKAPARLRAPLLAAVALLVARPLPALAGPPDAPSAIEDEMGPAEPLPPIDLPRPPHQAETGMEPESPASAADTEAEAAPDGEAARDAEPQRGAEPEPPLRARVEYDSKAAFQAGVGAFTSGIGGGFVADFGLRVLDVSLRYDYRLAFPDDRDAGVFSTHTLRLAWHRPLTAWANVFAGAGIGTIKLSVDDPWTDVTRTAASSGVAVIDAGLVLEYGPVSMAAIGVELLIPPNSRVLEGPTFMLTATITPLVILGAM